MVSFVALLAFGHSEFTLDQANKEGKRVLDAFDVPGPYTTEHVWTNGDDTFSIEVTAKSGEHYRFRAHRSTGALIVTRRDVKVEGPLPPRPAVVMVPDAQKAKAERGVAKLQVPYDTLHAQSMPWGRSDFVSVPIAFRSHPFVGRDKYGYGIRLDAVTGVLQMFSIPKSPPEFDFHSPRLSAADAVAAAKGLLVSDPPQEYDRTRRLKTWIEYVVDPSSVIYGSFSDAKLSMGWFKPENEAKARLTWAIPYLYATHSSRGTQSSLLTLMVDAETGKRLQSRD